MRITQNMLTMNNLTYISKNYERLGKIQDQIITGKKITRPSDDPVVAMKGMRYRSQVVEVEQFKRNLSEGFNWMENADSALDETGQVLHRIRELTVQASNDSYDKDARANIAKEITRLQEHIVALANTRVGDNYIFNGTGTDKAPINSNQLDIDFKGFSDALSGGAASEDYSITYQGKNFTYESTTGSPPEYLFKRGSGDEEETIQINFTAADFSTYEISHTAKQEQEHLDGDKIDVTTTLSDSDLVISHKDAVSKNTEDVEIEVLKGVTIPINIRSQEAFSVEMFAGLESIKKMLTNPDVKSEEISQSLDQMDTYMNNIVSTRAELGARTNRAEMVENRLLKQEVIANQTVSDNEDVDFEKAIIDLKIQESLHRASLAAGARIIQPDRKSVV